MDMDKKDVGGAQSMDMEENWQGEQLKGTFGGDTLQVTKPKIGYGDEIDRVSSSAGPLRSIYSKPNIGVTDDEIVRVSSSLSYSAKPFDVSTIYSPRLQPTPHSSIKPSSLGFLPGAHGQDGFSVWRDQSIIGSSLSSSNGSRGYVSPPSCYAPSSDDIGMLASTLEATNMGLGKSVDLGTSVATSGAKSGSSGTRNVTSVGLGNVAVSAATSGSSGKRNATSAGLGTSVAASAATSGSSGTRIATPVGLGISVAASGASGGLPGYRAASSLKFTNMGHNIKSNVEGNVYRQDRHLLKELQQEKQLRERE